MGYLAAMFLVFSISFSWVSGDKQKDELNLALEETQYENQTMDDQVRQAKIKASLDASKMNDLTKKISKLSKDKHRVELKLERTKLRRARLLRPQIVKIKDKIEAPYKTKLVKMEKAVKTAKANLAKLRAENDKLKRQYRELIRKNKERLSGDDNLIEKSPFSQDGVPSYIPVSQEGNPGFTPVSQDATPDSTPISQDGIPSYIPISQEGNPGFTPVSQDGIPDSTPISRDGTPDSIPISRDGTPDSTPISRDGTPDSIPISRDGTPDSIPISKDTPPPFVPEEELVKLDNDELVRLERIDRAPGLARSIPASKDLVSTEDILKTADEATDELPDYLRVEQIKLKEGWL
ncbi:MAG: hypothetical protein V3V95_00240 [Thermodesulfobacteriota bacterium]